MRSSSATARKVGAMCAGVLGPSGLLNPTDRPIFAQNDACLTMRSRFSSSRSSRTPIRIRSSC